MVNNVNDSIDPTLPQGCLGDPHTAMTKRDTLWQKHKKVLDSLPVSEDRFYKKQVPSVEQIKEMLDIQIQDLLNFIDEIDADPVWDSRRSLLYMQLRNLRHAQRKL